MRALRRQLGQQPAAERHPAHERAQQHRHRDRRGADDELDEIEPDGFVNQRGAAAGEKENEKTSHRWHPTLACRRFDVIVVGLGGMGSAAAAHAASRGKRVLGLEQFQPAHDQGSSHGRSRVIRLAYFEHPAYVPLLRRAYELWRRLEERTGRRLLQITGGLMIGSPDSDVVAGSLRSAREHHLDHEMLDAAQIRRRFPAFTPRPETVALFENEAGIVFPEEAIRAHLDIAVDNGAHAALRRARRGLERRAVGHASTCAPSRGAL